MNHRIVCDSSLLISSVTFSGRSGAWAAEEIAPAQLSAPELVFFEAASVIRRHQLAGLISHDLANLAHADLLALDIECWPYRLIAERVWELRANLTAYDASYVAVAEMTKSPLLTLDTKIARTPGIKCEVRTPPKA